MLSLTVHAGAWQVTYFGIWKRLLIGQFVDSHPGDAFQFIRFVRPKGDIILRHASDHTRSTSCASVQVDDHSESFIFSIFGRFHSA